jgi:hypothetical protein
MREVKNGVILSEEEMRRRRQRSRALALVLGALVLLFYAITIVKHSPLHS